MDQRRFITESKAALVKFLADHLNAEGVGDDPGEFEDLWENVGGGVEVVVRHPSWAVQGDLAKPLVILSRESGETNYTTTSQGQYLVEGYWKDVIFTISACTDEGTGGQITADDLASSIEVCFAKYSGELAEQGIVLWEMTDSEEANERATFENRAALQTRVLVAGPVVQPMKVELGRFLMTAKDQGSYYDGETLDEPMLLEAEAIQASSSTDATFTVTLKDGLGALVERTVYLPRATAQGTRLALQGGQPDDTFVEITNITVEGGQAGYCVGIYTKTGA